MKRQIIPKFQSFTSSFETLTGIRTFSHFVIFLAKFGSKHPYVNQLLWKPGKI